MSHRVYLYNVNQPGEPSEDDVMMMEWGYEIPLFLQPLLIDGGIIGGNNYNTHTPGNNSGLFYNAPQGIENLKRFYNFIERHQDELIDDVEHFKNAKENLFNYLQKLNQPYFNLDVWDVFNMNNTSHKKQAEEWLQKIKNNNTVINDAINTDNVFLLELSLFSKEVGEWFDDFKSFFNYSNYGYGWDIIDQPEPSAPLIFEEHSLWGLKDAAGKILIPPQYEKFYDFDDENMAVVFFDKRYGYVSKNGKEVIPPQFDDAFDFMGDYAIVLRAGKYGKINKEGDVIIDFMYQDMNNIGYNRECFTAKLNDKWGVIDNHNNVVLPFEYEERIESGNNEETYIITVKDRKTKLIFTKQFRFLGEFETSFVKSILIPNEQYIYEVFQNTKSDQNLLLDDHGKLLLSGYEKIIKNLYYVFIIRKAKKYGVMDSKGNMILGFEYESIDTLPVVLQKRDHIFCAKIANEEEHLHDDFLKVKKSGKYGLYLNINHFNTQISDFIYDDIISLKNAFLAVQINGLWGIIHALGELKVHIEYDLILKGDDAYCLKDDMVYTFDSNGIHEAEKTNLQRYINSNKELGYHYFSREVENRLQAYVDKGLKADEVFYQKAWILLEMDNEYCMAEAVYNFQQAVDLGHADAMNELAIIYEDAKGENPHYKNEEQSFHLFLKSAQLGSKTAMLNVGLCYADGMGTSINQEQMLYWYTEALKAGNMSAALNLGNYYYFNTDGNENYELALKYYLKAEKAGKSVDQELGWLYNHFNYPDKALSYLLKAVIDDEEGYASWQLGVYAEKGIEMEINIPLAIKHYKAAADMEYNEAFLNLYDIYTNDKDFKNKTLAEQYAQKIASAGLEIRKKKG